MASEVGTLVLKGLLCWYILRPETAFFCYLVVRNGSLAQAPLLAALNQPELCFRDQ